MLGYIDSSKDYPNPDYYIEYTTGTITWRSPYADWGTLYTSLVYGGFEWDRIRRLHAQHPQWVRDLGHDEITAKIYPRGK